MIRVLCLIGHLVLEQSTSVPVWPEYRRWMCSARIALPMLQCFVDISRHFYVAKMTKKVQTSRVISVMYERRRGEGMGDGFP